MILEKYLRQVKEKKEQGAVLVTAIIILTLLEILGFALITMSEVEASVASNLARNEEAYYSAEQGVYMGMLWISQNSALLSQVGISQTVDSSTFQGKSQDYTWGQNSWPYLRWETTITNLGYAPYERGRRTDVETYIYRIESNGQSTGQITRRLRVEFSFSPELSGAAKKQRPEYQIQTTTGVTTLKGKLAIYR